MRAKENFILNHKSAIFFKIIHLSNFIFFIEDNNVKVYDKNTNFIYKNVYMKTLETNQFFKIQYTKIKYIAC